MLAHRLRGWASIETILGQCLVFARRTCSRAYHTQNAREKADDNVTKAPNSITLFAVIRLYTTCGTYYCL